MLTHQERSFPKLLAQHYQIPEEMETFPAYIAQPAYNSKLNKVIIYTCFKATTSVSSLKQDPNYLGWLKENRVFIRSMNIELKCLSGLFTHESLKNHYHGQDERIHSNRPQKNTLLSSSPFQLIHDILGAKDPNTRSKTVMVKCFRKDASLLQQALETVFNPKGKVPFISFQVFSPSANYSLSKASKLRYFREHKNQMDGEQTVEIHFPSEFQQLSPKFSLARHRENPSRLHS